ncbi:hypothetical protein IPL68_03375 [Candidatus Saccharibacteria bacterium]|nr:MAG: hypothetical protein IPL68_03375 [Candidatus Saccharibacteria bacterium]
MSDETYKQYQEALHLDIDALQRLIDKSDGDAKAVFLKLKELVDSNALTTITGDYLAIGFIGTERDIKWTDCNDANFADLLVKIDMRQKSKTLSKHSNK